MAETTNPILASEITDAIRRHVLNDLEKIPEMRSLMEQLIRERVERSRIKESIGALDYSDIQKLFEDYMSETLETELAKFFDRLYNGILSEFRLGVSQRMDALEESIHDLKTSVLMASIHPYSWMEYELAHATKKFLKGQPGGKATLHRLCTHLADEVRLPMPGSDRGEKWHYVLRMLRRMEGVREIEGFLFELEGLEVREESELIATSKKSRQDRAVRRSSLRLVDE